MEDQLIINLFNERSEQAITALSDRYGALCGSLSYRILGDRRDAEECVNDAYLAVWNTIPPQKPRSLSSYVCRITRNLSLKKYRSSTAQKRNSGYELSLEELAECFSDHESVESRLDAKLLGESINRFLSALKPLDRVMFIQRYWFCSDVAEIAGHLNKSQNYVRVHLHRTRTKLKEYLSKEDYFEYEDRRSARCGG